MTIYVHNTLNNRREPFQNGEEGHIRMYSCGVTVYDVCHIGHGMQAIIYDMIRNYFEFKGFRVTYVRNFTDVDDKIIERAKQLGKTALEHSQDMIEASNRDIALLGVKPATHEPKVSEHIEEIVAMIESLVDKGFAYESEGDVYYNVRTYTDYGRLSNRDPEEMRCGARVEINTRKRDPLDFALWKKAKEGEVSWPSPWSEGRPGWHIECSAMAKKYLGENFDIHGGGKDLIFPHHENEIAQSCAAHDKEYANFWIHNGLITVDGKKMSKSAGNFLSIKDAVAKYHPETIRYTILKHHYSANINFDEQSYYDAYSRLLYFYNTLARIEELKQQFPNPEEKIPPGLEPPSLHEAFVTAMDDDFNTVNAIAELGRGFKFINDVLAMKKPKMKQKAHVLIRTAETLRECLAVLGLCEAPPQEALAGIQEYLIKARDIDVARVDALMAEREQARTDKNWARADEIRATLNEEGIQVMDGADGTTWQVQP
ncbi:cysteine--tRNA ligase [Sulfidibacter corallicola]|uniref:Cysteine--tRNA ligase n=1 Tax=Sulfidibacter corallicola TaxID=2818388 RepID=A0A8A4TWU4_SULCO|nr:cysteine--tRNA ligase [Sulfidibacter corallicola]QTD53594.1 cysteine--tRNA ligase [Sulfidibacter corallicola]